MCSFSFHGPERDALDGLHGDAALGADLRERLEVGGVLRVLHHHVVVGQQDGIEREALEAAEVHRGDGDAVAGDADEARQALRARLDGVLERAAGAERRLPLGFVDEVVELEQVDVIGLQPLERVLEAGLRLLVRALAGLGGEEEALAVRGIHPPTRRSERP